MRTNARGEQCSCVVEPTGPKLDRLLGTVVGSYELTSRVAEGGMAIIYAARHVRLPRRAAVKVLREELAHDRNIVDHFLDEARIVNEIAHPQVVEILDAGELAGDPPLVFLVMEFLEGVDLARHVCRMGAMDPLDAVEIADSLANTLGAVHKKHFLHSDLKAANIFLARRADGSSAVKLLDFGIAISFGFGGAVAPRIAGTPGSMAPEQIEGGALDERTDVYALGLLLYHMLTGAPAFDSSRFDAAYSKPRPIRRGQLRGICAPVPESLERVVMRCIEQRPEDRYANMMALRQALWASLGVQDAGRYVRGSGSTSLSDSPTIPPGGWPASTTSKRPTRERPWAVTAALSALGLAFCASLLRPFEPAVPASPPEARTCRAATVPSGIYHQDTKPLAAKPAVAAPGEAPQVSPQLPTRRARRVRSRPERGSTVKSVATPPVEPAPPETDEKDLLNDHEQESLESAREQQPYQKSI